MPTSAKLGKAAFMRRQARKGRSPAQARAAWNLKSYQFKPSRARRSVSRPKARSRSRATYRYRPNLEGSRRGISKMTREQFFAAAKESGVSSAAMKTLWEQEKANRAAARVSSKATARFRSSAAAGLKGTRTGKAYATPARSKKKKLSKKVYFSLMAGKGSPAQIQHWWNLKTGKVVRPKKGAKKVLTPAQKAAKVRARQRKRGIAPSRYFGQGRYRAARASFGPKIKGRYTYKYATPKGRLADIPDYALFGYPTKAAYLKAARTGTEKTKARLGKRTLTIEKRRQAAARAASKRILTGKGLFVPNVEETMYVNRRRKRRRVRRRYSANKKKVGAYLGRPARKSATSIKKLVAAGEPLYKGEKAIAAAYRKKHGGKPIAKKKSKPKAKPQSRRIRLGKRKSVSVMFTRNKKGNGRKTAGTRSAKQKAASKRNIKKAQAARGGKKSASRRIRLGKRKSVSVVFTKNRRRKARRNPRLGGYTGGSPGRSRALARRRSLARKRYRRNVGGGAFIMELQKALKIGVYVTGGFAAHRALSKLLEDQALVKMEAFSTGGAAPYRGVVAGAIVAAIGIPLAVKILPGGVGAASPAAVVASGIAASFIHKGVVTLLNQLDQPKIAGYLQGYPNAPGKAYSEYFQYKTGGKMGMGEYYQLNGTRGMRGFGQNRMRQAAAGVGRMRQAAAGMGQPMMQAAAGMGQMRQAAAGMGQGGIMQAAAGSGEYIAMNPQAIGEYEIVPTGIAPTKVFDGIQPNLHSAEQALSIAEAAAGFGGDVPMEATFEPTTEATAISELPGGSRAGVFQGGDGIFG